MDAFSRDGSVCPAPTSVGSEDSLEDSLEEVVPLGGAIPISFQEKQTVEGLLTGLVIAFSQVGKAG